MGNNVRGFDPNDELDTGIGRNSLVPLEDLSIIVKLEAERKPRSLISSDGTVNNVPLSNIQIPDGTNMGDGIGKQLTTNYTELGVTFIKSGSNVEGLGISDINIEFNSSFTPMVNISMIDVRGSSVFAAGNKSNYSVFFDLPYPIFSLEVKGYYGQTVRYCLHLLKFTTKFNASTGNFDISTEFIGYTYAFLTDMLVGYLRANVYTTTGKQEFDKYKAIHDAKPENSGFELPTIDEYFDDVNQLDSVFQGIKENSADGKKSTALAEKMKRLDVIDNFIDKQVKFLRTRTTVKDNGISIMDIHLESTISNGVKTCKYKSLSSSDHTDHTTTTDKLNNLITLYDEVILGTNYNIPSVIVDDLYQWNKIGETTARPSYLKLPKIKEKLFKAANAAQEQILPDNVTIPLNHFGYSLFKNELSEIRNKISRDKKNIDIALAKELAAISKDKLGFTATLQRLITILAAHVDVFYNTIKQVSLDAEKQDYSEIDEKNIIDNYGKRIYPWPGYVEADLAQTGYYDTWMGKVMPGSVEVKYIEELLGSLIDVAKHDDHLKKIKLNTGPGGQWAPINPLETLQGCVNPYTVDYFAQAPDILSITTAVLDRMFIFVTTTLSKPTYNEVKTMARLEAHSLYDGMLLKSTTAKMENLNKFYLKWKQIYPKLTVNQTGLCDNNHPYFAKTSTGGVYNYAVEHATTTGLYPFNRNVLHTDTNLLTAQNLPLRELIIGTEASVDYSLFNPDNLVKSPATYLKIVDRGALVSRLDDLDYYTDICKEEPSLIQLDNYPMYSHISKSTKQAYRKNQCSQFYSSLNIGVQDFTKIQIAPGKVYSSTSLFYRDQRTLDAKPEINGVYKDYYPPHSYSKSKALEDYGLMPSEMLPTVRGPGWYKSPIAAHTSWHGLGVSKYMIVANRKTAGQKFSRVMDDSLSYRCMHKFDYGSNWPTFRELQLDAVRNPPKVDANKFYMRDFTFALDAEGWIFTYSLFGSELYHTQTSEYAKAFLFINTLPLVTDTNANYRCDFPKQRDFNIFSKYKDLTQGYGNTRALFSNKSGVIKAPYPWILYIGSILYRLYKTPSTEDLIKWDSTVKIGHKVVKMADDPDKNYLLQASSEYTIDGGLIFSNTVARTPSVGGLQLSYKSNNTGYNQIDDVIKNLPLQVRNEFIDQFVEWVNGPETTDGTWLSMSKKLSMFKEEKSTYHFNKIYQHFGYGTTYLHRNIDTPDCTDTSAKNYFGSSYNSFNFDTYDVIYPITSIARYDTNETEDIAFINLYGNTETDRLKTRPNFQLKLKEKATVLPELYDFFFKSSKYIVNGSWRIWDDSDRVDNWDALIKVNNNSIASNVSETMGKVYMDAFRIKFDELLKPAPDAPTPVETDNEIKQRLFNNLDDDNIKLSLYRSIKSIYEKWVAGSNQNNKCVFDNGDLIDSFRFVDRDFSEIGNDFLVNPTIMQENIMGDMNQSFYDVVTRILVDNYFDFVPLPTYLDYKDETELKKAFRPYPYNSVENMTSGPTFVCMYAGQRSIHLDVKGSRHRDDGMQNGDTLGNGTPYFEVSYGKENQSIFKNIELDQEEFSETQEALKIIDDISLRGRDGTKGATGQNLFNIYNTRSYSCSIEMLGDAMIQPMMYFRLSNIPMFRGMYLIINVSHSISPNNMTTKFKGVRIRATKTPLIDETTLYLNILGGVDGGVYTPSQEPYDQDEADRLETVYASDNYTNKQAYYRKFKDIAMSACLSTGLFPSVMLAQGLLESNIGKSKLSTTYHNHFGITADATFRQNNNESKYIYMTDRYYRVYTSDYECYKERNKFLIGNKRYKKAGVFDAQNASEQAVLLKAAGYAEDQYYAYKLKGALKNPYYNLTQYDNPVP